MNFSALDREKLQAVSRRNDVAWLGLFGSAARGEATQGSDVDLLVRFAGRKSLLDLVRIEREMSEALGRKVDLSTEACLSPHLRDRILGEMVLLCEEVATRGNATTYFGEPWLACETSSFTTTSA